jgi:hypothetical protein
LQQHGADRFVMLGDFYETGNRVEETVRLLQEVEAGFGETTILGCASTQAKT